MLPPGFKTEVLSSSPSEGRWNVFYSIVSLNGWRFRCPECLQLFDSHTPLCTGSAVFVSSTCEAIQMPHCYTAQGDSMLRIILDNYLPFTFGL